MAKKLILDTSSIVSFIKYYKFDKNDSKIIHERLETFFLTKIKNGEIIIIDRVHRELRKPESKKLKDKMKPFGYSTEYLLDKIEPLLNENLIEIRARNYPTIELESERDQYKEKYAD